MEQKVAWSLVFITVVTFSIFIYTTDNPQNPKNPQNQENPENPENPENKISSFIDSVKTKHNLKDSVLLKIDSNLYPKY